MPLRVRQELLIIITRTHHLESLQRCQVTVASRVLPEKGARPQVLHIAVAETRKYEDSTICILDASKVDPKTHFLLF